MAKKAQKIEESQVALQTSTATVEAPVALSQPMSEPQLEKSETTPEMDKQKSDQDIFNTDGELVVDVFETDNHFVVTAAIAGVQIKDLDISVDKDMMVIKGQRENPHSDPGRKYFYQECYWGPFSRKIVLPENVDTEQADAEMHQGVLTIKIPKLADKKSAGIQVS